MIRRVFLILLLSFAFSMPLIACAETPVLQPRILAEYPHDTGTSTQGLFFYDGLFYESSGGYEESFIAIVQPDTGLHLAVEPIPGPYFAEGIAPHRNTLYLLTWKSGVGFVHDLETLAFLSRFPHNKNNPTEGWGLATDGTRFIRSSGSSRLTFHNPDDFALISSLQVTDDGTPVRLLNELEVVENTILANIWKSDRIAVINPESGEVIAWIDLSTLRERIDPDSRTANGIAYDPTTGRIFVTGKHWDKLFVIEVDGLLEGHLTGSR